MINTTWMITAWDNSGTPKKPIEDTQIQAIFASDRRVGKSGCNQYRIVYQTKGKTLKVTSVASPKMADMLAIME
ncbi:MAG: META domain-containing protein [Limnoraphis sp.]